MALYKWTVEGESHHPHSSPEWWPESTGGTVESDCGGDALVKIIAGGASPRITGEPAAPVEDTIPWDIIDCDRGVVITIEPTEGEKP